MKYIMANTTRPLFKIYPRFLDQMDISANAKIIYVNLLDRTFESKRNGKKWKDNKGRVFIRCSNAEAGAMVGKKERIAKKYLKELKNVGLIECKRNYSESNTIYVGYPDNEELSNRQSGKKSPNNQAENYPINRQDIALTSGTGVPTSKNIQSKNIQSIYSEDAQSAPALNDVIDYFIENGSTEEQAEEFMDYWEALDWKIKNGTRITKWQAKANSWMRKNKQANQSENHHFFPRL